MSHLAILLPFSLPPAELAADLLRQCKTPAFSALLSQARSANKEIFDDFSRTLAHEIWLTKQFYTADLSLENTSPPIAPALLEGFNLPPDKGFWFIAQPSHLHIARDHLVLTDHRQLYLSERESRDLFAAVLPLFREIGLELAYGDAKTWFIRADGWQDLQTATPDAACGRNIDIWLPKGGSELAWRKLQNEVQMHWHTDAVNAEREARGAKPINALWLWGGAAAPQPPMAMPYTDLFNLPGWTQAYGASTRQSLLSATLPEILDAKPERGLLIIDKLIGAALAGDWGTWLQELHQIENEWLAPAHAALKSGTLKEIRLVLSDNTRLVEWRVTKASLRKFWTKPSLDRLLP